LGEFLLSIVWAIGLIQACFVFHRGMAVCLAAFSTAAFATPGNPVNNTFCALATPVTSGGLQEGGEFVGDAMAAICDDLAAYTTATVSLFLFYFRMGDFIDIVFFFFLNSYR